MIENYLINSGLGCGTVLNYHIEIINNVTKGNTDRWYFRTPIKTSGHDLKTAVINLAFHFRAKESDTSEKIALSRLEILRKDYEDDLMAHLRSWGFIVPPDLATFTIIPFWSDKFTEQVKRSDFGGLRIHILSATLTVKYRESWFAPIVESEPVNPFLERLQAEQVEIDERLFNQNVYNTSAEFDALDQETKDLLTSQYAAMVIYNDCLKARILLLTQ